MKLSQLGQYSKEPPVVAFRHEEWMRKDEPFSEEAISFVSQELGKTDRDRKGSFSASGLGSCPRQQQFTYLGLQQLSQSGQRMGVLLNGTFVHLRLQAAGLTAGWLAEAEVPIPENPLGLKGTMDGVIDEGSVLEAKSQNDHGFKRLQYATEAKEEHVFQAATYLVCSGKDKAVILYENKNTQDVKEFIVKRDDALDEKIIKRALQLQNKTGDEELFDPLPDCVNKKGWRYDYCPFKDRCLKIKNFKEAVTMAEKESEEDGK